MSLLISMGISIKDVLLDFLKDNKASVAGYLFFSLTTPLSNVYLPSLYGKIISLINESQTIDAEIRRRFGYILVLWVIVQMFWNAMNVIDSRFIPKLRKHVRRYVVDKVLCIYKENYSEEELGGILAEIVRLPDEIEDMFHNIRNHILPMIYLIIFSVGYFAWTNPRLGGASVVIIGVYMYLAIRYSNTCIPVWNQMNASNLNLHNEISDCFGNLLNIYTANRDEQERHRLDAKEDEFLTHHRSKILCTGNYRLALNLGYIFLFCGINVFSFYLFSKGIIKLQETISILIITLELVSKMASFVGSLDRFMYEIIAISNIQRTLDTLDKRNEGRNLGCGLAHPPITGEIALHGFSKSYGDKLVLDDVNLRVAPGETVVLFGEIGSGKTSLIKSIIRLVPYSGVISIDGVDVQDIDLGYLRENILYIPQNPRLFNRSIYENIAYGNDVDRETIRRTLDSYGIHLDLDSPVGKFGQGVSGGQRQIIYLLRCLFKDAPIVLMDEPTSSLDTDTKDTIMRILDELLRTRTVIIITHDREMIRYATVAFEINNKKIFNYK